MIDDRIARQALVEKNPDAEWLREMVGFAARRLRKRPGKRPATRDRDQRPGRDRDIQQLRIRGNRETGRDRGRYRDIQDTGTQIPGHPTTESYK